MLGQIKSSSFGQQRVVDRQTVVSTFPNPSVESYQGQRPGVKAGSGGIYYS